MVRHHDVGPRPAEVVQPLAQRGRRVRDALVARVDADDQRVELRTPLPDGAQQQRALERSEHVTGLPATRQERTRGAADEAHAQRAGRQHDRRERLLLVAADADRADAGIAERGQRLLDPGVAAVADVVVGDVDDVQSVQRRHGGGLGAQPARRALAGERCLEIGADQIGVGQQLVDERRDGLGPAAGRALADATAEHHVTEQRHADAAGRAVGHRSRNDASWTRSEAIVSFSSGEVRIRISSSRSST